MTRPAERRPQRKTAARCETGSTAPASIVTPQAVADAVNGLNQSRLTHLLAKTVDINLHEIGFAVEVIVPNVFDDFRPGSHVRSPDQQKLEHGEFFGRKCKSVAETPDSAAMPIQFYVSELQGATQLAHPTPYEGAHTRKE